MYADKFKIKLLESAREHQVIGFTVKNMMNLLYS